jgi:glycosyltransferase involved in cell wall biosynthesis
MKIGFLQPYDSCGPPDPGGSLGIWTWEVARRLARCHDVMVCGRRFNGLRGNKLAEGVHFRRFTMKADERLKWLLRRHRRPVSQESALCDLFLLRAAIVLRGNHCDIIHLFNLSRFVPVVARLNRHARIFLNMHCDFLAGFDYSLVSRHLSHVNGIIGCSDFITDDIRARFPQHAERCRTVYNGADLEKFRPRRAEPSETLITVGRISPEKGLHVLLEAFAKVLMRRPNARLKVIGRESILPPEAISKMDNGNARVRHVLSLYRHNYLRGLEKQASELCQGKVSFLGALPPARVPAEMQDAAILVQPSLYETFGMPPVEAMACGLPVVASRAGGLAEIVVDGETGLLVEPENPGQLAEALIELLENPARARAMGMAGRRRAELFSWEAIVSELISCYGRPEGT